MSDKQYTPAEWNAVGWFEIPVTDLPRAKKFYEVVLGTQLEVHNVGGLEMAWFPMKPGAPGAPGSLVKGEHFRPGMDGTVVYFTVADIAATLDRAARAGGEVIMPKMSIGEYGFVAFFADTEGNRLALHSMS